MKGLLGDSGHPNYQICGEGEHEATSGIKKSEARGKRQDETRQKKVTQAT